MVAIKTIFTISENLSLVNILPKPLSGLSRLKSGTIGFKLVTQPPTVTVLSKTTTVMTAAKMTQPSSPILAVSCSRVSMLPGCASVLASKESCWLNRSRRRSNMRGESTSSVTAPVPSTAKWARSRERVT